MASRSIISPIALIATLVVTSTFAAVSPALAPDVEAAEPLQMTTLTSLEGRVVSTNALEVGDIFVSVMPDQQFFGDVANGSMVSQTVLAPEAVTVSGDRFFVDVDPLALPTDTVSEYGVTTFAVMIQDPDDTTAYSVSYSSVRAVVLPDGSLGWVDSWCPPLR